MDAPRLLASIARAQRQFFLEEGPAQAFDAVLADLLELTESEYGFIGEVVSRPSAPPFLRMYAISDIAWNDATRRMVGQAGAAGLEFHNLATLFGAVILSGEPVFANDPASDPRSGGLPAGHPPLRAFLGVPFHAGRRLVGMAGIANRPGGYDASLLTALEPFLVTCGSLVAARRAMTDSAAAEASLRSRQSLDALLSWIARVFVEVTPEGTDAAIEEALRRVMAHVGAQHVCFGRMEAGGERAHITHAVGKGAETARGQHYELAATPFVRRKMREQDFLFVRNVSALPKRARADSGFQYVRASAFLRGSQDPDSDGCAIYWNEPSPAVRESDLRALCALPQLIQAVLERRDTQLALQKSEAQFRALADLLPQAVLVLDEKRQRLFFNRAADRLAFQLASPAGSDGGRVHPDDLERLKALAAEAVVAGQSGSFEVRLRVDGGYQPFLVDYVPSQTGTVAAGLWTAFDISGHRELEQRVREAEKLEAVGRLAGGIAHDFNNMLTAIMGHAELAREGRGGADEDLTAIEQTAVRAAELVRQLLAFARRRTIEPRILDLNELVTGVEVLVRRLIGEHIALTLGGFAEPLYLNVDPGQLEQVIVNLALNARDAMPNGGSLDITTHRHAAENQVELRVSDSGGGMDASTRSQAFEPFFTTKGVGHGTGLGLATCYGIVRQAGGEILLESEPQKGTTVRVRLPSAASPSDAAHP